MKISLLEKPDFTEYLETGIISEKYKIDCNKLQFKVKNEFLKFNELILEIHRTSDKKLLYIYVSFENIESTKLLKISEVVSIEQELIEKLKKAKIVSVIFSIDGFLIDNFIAERENNLEKDENIFDIKDSNENNILLDFKNYKLCDILF